MAGDEGLIISVTGPVSPDRLGTTITHEHLFIDTVDSWYSPPDSSRERAMAEKPVTIENLHYVLANSTGNRDNLRLESTAEAKRELARFTRAGGQTIVEVTPKGVGADPRRVLEVSRSVGATVVQGTAFYTRNTHPRRLEQMSVDDIEAEFVGDLTEGFGGTSIRAGIIGEIGLSGDVHEQESTVLRAGLRAARRTGAAIAVHPPIFDTVSPSGWGLRVLDIADEEDVPAEQVILCHQDLDDVLDRPDDLSNQLESARRGAYVEFDCWGGGHDNLQRGRAFPSDNWRIRATKRLVDDGYASQLLFSQDVWKKTKRTSYGGLGYAHILNYVVPRLENRGVPSSVIETILIDNPKCVLAFAPPRS